MSGHDTVSLESGAGARAANTQVDDLGDVIRSLDKKAQGEFSLRFLVAAHNVDELRGIAPAVHRVFVDARAQVMEETLGNLSAFYAMFPGNGKVQRLPDVAGRRPSCAAFVSYSLPISVIRIRKTSITSI
jgi:type IV secretion system protein VirB4